VTGGLRANLMRRLDRFERRLIAAAKKQHADVMHDIGTRAVRFILWANRRSVRSTSCRCSRVMVWAAE